MTRRTLMECVAIIRQVCEGLRLAGGDNEAFSHSMEYNRALEIARDADDPLVKVKVRCAVEDFMRRRAKEETNEQAELKAKALAAKERGTQ